MIDYQMILIGVVTIIIVFIIGGLISSDTFAFCGECYKQNFTGNYTYTGELSGTFDCEKKGFAEKCITSYSQK